MSQTDERIIRAMNDSIGNFTEAMAGLRRVMEILSLELMHLQANIKASEESSGRGASGHGGWRSDHSGVPSAARRHPLS